MLPVIYERRNGVKIPTNDLLNDLSNMVEYLDAFELALNETMRLGEPTTDYVYYFDQLKMIAELYPNFEYDKYLEKKYCDIISSFYYKPQPKKYSYY